MSNTDESKGYFWNSQNGDRKYDSDSFGEWLMPFFTGGVFYTDCKVTATAGMTVSMAPGYVNIVNPYQKNAKVRVFKDEELFTLNLADQTRPRIDTIVIERNDNDRQIVAKVVTGTPAAIPVATPPVRSNAIHQLVLAEILVGAGVSSITNANITDKRGDSSVCGLVTSTVYQYTFGTTELTSGVSELPTGTFYFQYE